MFEHKHLLVKDLLYFRASHFCIVSPFLKWISQPCKGIQSMALSADISKADDVEKMVDAIVSKWATVHIACNNAGINMNSASEETSLEEWDKTFSVNLRGTFMCCQVGDAARSFLCITDCTFFISLSEPLATLTGWFGLFFPTYLMFVCVRQLQS